MEQTCKPRHGRTGAILLILIGAIFMLVNAGVLDPQLLRQGWPLLLIGLGAWKLLRRF
ncbi:hypothetical protein SAMN02745857_01299 [Andreprevotia lacus DSM 23236]|jgi:hypothetical protein|uniref:LiaI-LiaF-like transmembrane region domain-containing protein n=1 Tax=Andreprevotia lacus DSM 23236 TaxID=1121001 RepID=A0A1W1XDL6_9NEIS|nr:DUF5668 domain-containing protein [Andreprevotia lacus]SMC21977.1 hypothetical protein SAMN02745857_01299 [Andreprevotia lacus DSM 23236]